MIKIKIISLIDNENYNPFLTSEHGLSLYIEFNNKKFLLDTGASNNFIYNAKKLNINLFELDYIIISHGHYDHIGGLKELLKINTKAKVYLKSSCNGDYYSKKIHFMKYIGPEKDLFSANSDRFVYINHFREIFNNVYIIPTIEKKYDNSPICENLYMLNKNIISKDTFSHELIVVFQEGDSINIFTGCSHNGIVNMIYTVTNIFKDKYINLIIGGFHLKSLKDSHSYIYSLCSDLSSFNPKKIYTCHCTGLKGYQTLKKILSEEIIYFSTGEEIITH